LGFTKVVETDLAKFGPMIELSANLPPEAGFLVTHQFRAPDEKSLVQLGALGITVNALAYPGFERFRQSIAKVLETYIPLARAESVSRLGLRYLNLVPPIEGRLLGSFAIKLDWPALEGGDPKSLAARRVVSYKDPPGELGIAIADPTPGAFLDLDFFLLPGRTMSKEEVLGWLDGAHERVYEAFCAMVSSELFASWE